MSLRVPHYLLIIYLILFIVCAISPYDRAVRWAENIPVMVTVLLLVVTYKKFQFSSTAYVLMSLWILMHTIGWHYTFERVPFDRFTNFFWFERNMYDRIAHYIIGFYAYPLIEYLDRTSSVKQPWIMYCMWIFAIFTLASVYEIIERRYAATAWGEQGIAFLGSQGDIRDAQKDMLADGLGAITSAIVYWMQKRWSLKS